MSEPPSTPFALQRNFPNVIITYSSKTDGGNKRNNTVSIRSLSKTAPAPLPGGFKLGDIVY